MNKLINNYYYYYYLSLLSFIIIVGVFVSITSLGYHSYSAQEGGGGGEVESNNDIFSDLSRNLPSIEEDIPYDNKESTDSETPIFENQDTKDLDDNNKISNGENLVESTGQGASSESIEKSFSNGFTDSGEESDIINEDDGSSNPESSSSSSSSSSNSVSNDEAIDKNIINR